MKSTESGQPWYLRERAEGLGVIYLTEDSRVEVNRAPDVLSGLDIVATLRENGHLGGRIFGVEIKAARTHEPMSDNKPGHDNPKPRMWSIPNSRASFFRDIPFPVCLLYFTVDDDQGLWGWIKQPAADADAGSRLIFNSRVSLSLLTAQEVTKIVSEVERWYNERK